MTDRADPWNDLEAALDEHPGLACLRPLLARARERIASDPHGDLPKWQAALDAMPPMRPACDADRAAPRLGEPTQDPAALEAPLMALHPWRKGPFELGGTTIDSEWRSDLKWARVAPHVDLAGETVLDVGCGNGYFGWRMLGAGAHRVIGVDPTLLFTFQWLACQCAAGARPNHVLPLGIEDLPVDATGFDTVFSMGVLYHRRDPHQHLAQLHGLLRDGGRLVLETLVLPQDDAVLHAPRRYARMRNVHAVPGEGHLLGWLERAAFTDARVVDVTATTPGEQRSTRWMRFESLADALDPADPARTVEGHPAPRRAVLIAHR